MIGHLARRAAEHLSKADFLEKQANAFAELNYEMPAWGVGLLAFTAIAFSIFAFSIEYIVRLLIVNLAIVESPTSATVSIYKPVSLNDDPDAPLEKRDPYADVEVEQATVFSKPMTSSIRRSVRHLVSVGGFRARWRGIRLFGLYTAMVGAVHLVAMVLPVPLGPIVGTFGGALAGVRLHCAWTHATIAMPSTKTLKQRLIPRSQWRQLAGPTIAKVAATQASAFLTIGSILLSVNNINDLIDAKSKACLPYMLWLALPFAVAVATFLCVMVPAYVVLVRKEASLLPEDEDTIVPVDRTFGGRVDEATGILSPRDAWKGFTNEAYLRVVKLYVKYFFITVGLLFAALQVLAAQVYLIMGDNLDVLIDSAMARLETMQL